MASQEIHERDAILDYITAKICLYVPNIRCPKKRTKHIQRQQIKLNVLISGIFWKSQRSCPTVGPDSSQAGIGNDDMNWPHPKTVHSVAAGAWRCVKGVSFRHFFTPWAKIHNFYLAAACKPSSALSLSVIVGVTEAAISLRPKPISSPGIVFGAETYIAVTESLILHTEFAPY